MTDPGAPDLPASPAPPAPGDATPLQVPAGASPQPELPPTAGFEMSGKRAVTEIAVVVAVLLGVPLFVIWVMSLTAGLLIGYVPTSIDTTLGEQATKIMSVTHVPCANPEPQQYVETVAAPLLKALENPEGFHFSFRVIKSPDVNAFALPGGFITVESALLETAETGDEVAAVLAHEIHHSTRRHATVRMLRELGASIVLNVAFGGTSVAVPAGAVRELISTVYSRSEESEADALGLKLVMKAGIDPRGMSRFFDRLAKSTDLTPPAMLSTHPDPGDRAEIAAKAAAGAQVTTELPSPKGVHCL